MISESKYWKDELLHVAKKLKTWKNLKNLNRLVQKSYLIEKNIFIGAYSVRKLFDSFKVTTHLSTTSLNVIKYQPTGKNVTFTSRLDIEELFDLENGMSYQFSLREFCNQIVHSYVFVINYADYGLTGIYLTSDRERNSQLLYVAVDEITRVFELIGKDDPSEMSMIYNPKRKDYDIQLYSDQK